MRRGLTLADFRLLAEFRYHLRSFLAFSARAAEEVGLAPQQYQALLAIKGHKGLESPTVIDLAEALLIRHNSAVGLVDRLAAMHLLVRRKHVKDRRRVALVLTAAAEKLLARLSTVHRDELRRLTPLLTPVLAKLERE